MIRFILQTNSDFDAKPMVMLLGQYSTGKTTFIKHLLKSSYPGKSSISLFGCKCVSATCARIKYIISSSVLFLTHITSAGAHIGPEPTTDRFVVVMVFANPTPIIFFSSITLQFMGVFFFFFFSFSDNLMKFSFDWAFLFIYFLSFGLTCFRILAGLLFFFLLDAYFVKACLFIRRKT